MEPRTYEVGKKKITISDEKILELIEKTENLELNPAVAYRKVSELLVKAVSSDSSVNNVFEAMDLAEAIYKGFDAGKATPIMERYAIKNGLSGRLTT